MKSKIMKEIKTIKRFFILFICLTLISSCAAFETGPKISDMERQKAAAILKQKAELDRLQQKQRFIEIGTKLLDQADNPPVFSFELIESDAVNAYAGYTQGYGKRIIGVTTGMLR